MKMILEKYYDGITQQIRSEVDFINSLFTHQGIKGEGNETILRELVTKFLPKKYSVGTGVVIDRKGNQSKQIDIIIYDQLSYASILSLSSVHLFPVDIVHAVIEIKTTLDPTKAKNSLENIASVRSLDIVKDSFTVWEHKGENTSLNTYEPTPPTGFIFSYNSSAESFETFKGWFTPEATSDVTKYPTLIGCLDQGMVRFKDIRMPSGQLPEGFAIPLNKGDDTAVWLPEKQNSFISNGIVYPVKKVIEHYCPIDQSRILLLFVVILGELISARFLNPNIKFSEHYFKESTLLHIKV